MTNLNLKPTYIHLAKRYCYITIVVVLCFVYCVFTPQAWVK